MWWTTTICRLPKGSALPREVDDKKVEGENKAVNINMEMEDKKVEGKNRVVAEPSPLSGIWLAGWSGRRRTLRFLVRHHLKSVSIGDRHCNLAQIENVHWSS